MLNRPVSTEGASEKSFACRAFSRIFGPTLLQNQLELGVISNVTS